MPELKTVSVSILGKDYQVNCKPDEVASLMQSAQHLDKRMKEIKNGGSILGLDRIAVMAALNISNDYLAEATKNKTFVDHQELEIKTLASKLDRTLNKLKQ
ncbi:MAG: cell division protein ZapA [Flavobacterium sp.]|jgi:cell division protein ZapA